MAITLTQDSYRLWARIGGNVTMFGVLVTDTDARVLAQLAQLAADSVVHETP
jgi:hypothetical protein